jgi:hypothetical protein
MAEHKRHREVPQERFLERHPPAVQSIKVKSPNQAQKPNLSSEARDTSRGHPEKPPAPPNA